MLAGDAQPYQLPYPSPDLLLQCLQAAPDPLPLLPVVPFSPCKYLPMGWAPIVMKAFFSPRHMLLSTSIPFSILISCIQQLLTPVFLHLYLVSTILSLFLSYHSVSQPNKGKILHLASLLWVLHILSSLLSQEKKRKKNNNHKPHKQNQPTTEKITSCFSRHLRGRIKKFNYEGTYT